MSKIVSAGTHDLSLVKGGNLFTGTTGALPVVLNAYKKTRLLTFGRTLFVSMDMTIAWPSCKD